MLRNFPLQPLICYLLVVTGGSGCALLEEEGRSTTAENPLPPIVAPRDAVELEVFVVDRTVGDPLLGAALWNSLHELSSTPPQIRHSLEMHGIQLAMSPSRPPQTVQALLALSGGQDPTRCTYMNTYVLPANQPIPLPVTVMEPEASLRLPADPGQPLVLKHGHGLLQVQASKVEEGWARVEVTPMIQHGADVPRYRATAEEWVVDQGQQAIMLYDQRFTAELNEGELLVVGYTGGQPESVGERFFRGEWKSIPIERLVIIRLRGMHRIDPVRSN
ncbi:MAG: hypothetical protein KDA58_01940 [Planctomycetaceae bacterium]|nr:hypothetical protein [Planctomycetaceae bacterium]